MAAEIEAQDVAEVYDEDNLDSDSARIKGLDEELNFDDMPSVFDATAAVGDDDDDEALIGDDMDDEDIVASATDNDDADDDLEDDDLLTRSADAYEPENSLDSESDVGDEDPDDVDDIDAGSPDEVGLRYAGDLANTPGGHSAAQRYESRNLSDADLNALGYGDGAKAAGREPGVGSEPHEHDDDAAGDLPDDPADDPAGDLPEDHPAHPDREDERLDEGVEESFPASDPVSVKHIT